MWFAIGPRLCSVLANCVRSWISLTRVTSRKAFLPLESLTSKVRPSAMMASTIPVWPTSWLRWSVTLTSLLRRIFACCSSFIILTLHCDLLIYQGYKVKPCLKEGFKATFESIVPLDLPSAIVVYQFHFFVFHNLSSPYLSG